MNDLETAVLKTLCYRDLFDYPLSGGEVAEFLVEDDAHPSQAERVLAQLTAEGKIGQAQGFYFLPGREKIAAVRRQRELISERKYARALKLSQILRRDAVSPKRRKGCRSEFCGCGPPEPGLVNSTGCLSAFFGAGVEAAAR